MDDENITVIEDEDFADENEMQDPFLEEDDTLEDTEDNDETSLTFLVKNGRICSKTDELQAMVQAVDKILKTERFVYPIYSDQYGNDLPELIGKPISYAAVEVERMVKEALLADSRITDVKINKISLANRNTLLVSGKCTTVYGEIPIRNEVIINES